MKIIGLILIIAGFAMLVLNGIGYTTKEKLIDAGPLQVSKKEHKTLTWPNYAGAIVVVAGVAFFLAGRYAGRSKDY